MTEKTFTKDWWTFKPLTQIKSLIDEIYFDDNKNLRFRFLEIGSFEGRSCCWYMDNFPISQIDCIDPYLDDPEYNVESMIDVMKRFLSNTKEYGRRVNLCKNFSTEILYLLKIRNQKFDFIYIDGKHTQEQVIIDALMSWEILKPNGMILYDDYDWDGVKKSVDYFMECKKDKYTVKLKTETMVCIQKGE